MAFRLRNFAPLGPEEGLNGWLHKLVGWWRELFAMGRDRYINALAAQGYSIASARQSDGSAACCHICGYHMASIIANDGWAIEACSHSMAGKMLGHDKFHRWRSQLPAVESKPAGAAPSLDGAPSSRKAAAPIPNCLQTSRH